MIIEIFRKDKEGSYQSLSGRIILKQVSFPFMDDTWIDPPCCLIIEFEI